MNELMIRPQGSLGSQEEVVDLREYIYFLRLHMKGILGFATLCSLLAVLVIFSLKPIYEGKATLLIEAANATNVVSIEEVYQLTAGKNEYYKTQFEILKSRELGLRVVKRNPEIFNDLYAKANTKTFSFLNPLSAPQYPEDDELLHQKRLLFKRMLSVKLIPNTQLVTVSVESNNPEYAAILSNDLAQVYIENNLEARLQMTQQASKAFIV